VALGTAALVVVADQLTKSWAVHRLAHGSIHVVWKLDLILSFNTGSAFGLAKGWAPVITALAALVVVGLLAVVRGVRSDAVAAALGLVLGGALGNLADRVFRGHHGAVVDFIALHFWPTFNVADSCITVGVILAVVLSWRADAAAGADVDGTHAER
jgi:signal peptidase II